MTVTVTNAQREAPVNTTRMNRLARQTVRRLRLRGRGTLAITFLDRRQIRALNRRFLRHDRPTDVLSFRYNHVRGSPAPARRVWPGGFGVRGTVGEIFVAPALARAYAASNRLPYEEELSRYVVHGILHWLGHDDATPAQRRKMRALEDSLLASPKSPMTKLQSPNRLVIS
jgi:probable rRNA maturation factor